MEIQMYSLFCFSEYFLHQWQQTNTITKTSLLQELFPIWHPVNLLRVLILDSSTSSMETRTSSEEDLMTKKLQKMQNSHVNSSDSAVCPVRPSFLSHQVTFGIDPSQTGMLVTEHWALTAHLSISIFIKTVRKNHNNSLAPLSQM